MQEGVAGGSCSTSGGGNREGSSSQSQEAEGGGGGGGGGGSGCTEVKTPPSGEAYGDDSVSSHIGCTDTQHPKAEGVKIDVSKAPPNATSHEASGGSRGAGTDPGAQVTGGCRSDADQPHDMGPVGAGGVVGVLSWKVVVVDAECALAGKLQEAARGDVKRFDGILEQVQEWLRYSLCLNPGEWCACIEVSVAGAKESISTRITPYFECSTRISKLIHE